MFDLAVDGVQMFYTRRPSAKRLVRREPLVGMADGSNVIFLTSQKPFLYDSLIVYAANLPLTPLTITNWDADGGVVQMYVAPTVGLTADYTAVPLTARQVIYIAWTGFELMQALWSRDLRLSSSNSTYVAASADDAHIYICSVTDNVPTDPVTGSLTLSTSPRQKALLARCIEYAFLDAATQDAALSDIAIRERLGGIAIDPTRRTRNLVEAKQALWDELQRALLSAQEEVLSDGSQYVTDIPVPHTDEYKDVWQWQTGEGVGLLTRWWQ